MGEGQFRMNLLYTCRAAMEREACEIRHGEEEVDIVMSSKLGHYAQSVGRMVMQREVEERGRGGRGHAGRVRTI